MFDVSVLYEATRAGKSRRHDTSLIGNVALILIAGALHCKLANGIFRFLQVSSLASSR